MATDETAVPNPLRESHPEQSPAVTPNEFRSDDATAALARLEALLREIRGALDAGAREQQLREFSIARLLGAVVQVLAIGLTLWAALDWSFGEVTQLLIKLTFAMVLQVMALTAFFQSREPR